MDQAALNDRIAEAAALRAAQSHRARAMADTAFAAHPEGSPTGRPATPRASALARRLWSKAAALPPATWQSLAAWPAWTCEPAEARAQRCLFVGGYLLAGALRATVQGRVLRAIAEQVGQDGLQAFLAHGGETRSITPVWSSEPARDLTAAGREALLRAGNCGPDLRSRLERLLPRCAACAWSPELDAGIDAACIAADEALFVGPRPAA